MKNRVGTAVIYDGPLPISSVEHVNGISSAAVFLSDGTSDGKKPFRKEIDHIIQLINGVPLFP